MYIGKLGWAEVLRILDAEMRLERVQECLRQ